MEMYFLIIWLSGHPVVMPERYLKEQCEKIGKDYLNSKCIPAPSFPFVTFVEPKNCGYIGNNVITCNNNLDTLTPLDKRYPGYTCGGHDSECKLIDDSYFNCARSEPIPGDPSRGQIVKSHCEPTTGK